MRKSTEWGGGEGREKEKNSFHVLIQAQNAHSRQVWARLKLHLCSLQAVAVLGPSSATSQAHLEETG